jgi:hypothetical protein
MTTALPPSRSWPFKATVALFVAGLGHVSLGVASAAEAEAWTVIGQQGLVRFVMVPTEQAPDSAAYERQIVRLCDPEHTCFLNFYTNSTGARLEMPLPAAIANEATATYRRSVKNGLQVFMWSCRLKVPGSECF